MNTTQALVFLWQELNLDDKYGKITLYTSGEVLEILDAEEPQAWDSNEVANG